MTPDNCIDVYDAAAELDLHPQSVRRLIKRGRLASVRFGKRVLIERTVLQAYARQRAPKGRQHTHRLYSRAEKL